MTRFCAHCSIDRKSHRVRAVTTRKCWGSDIEDPVCAEHAREVDVWNAFLADAIATGKQHRRYTETKKG